MIIKPTVRSETASPDNKIMEGCERRDGEVTMTVKTKELPKIATNTSGTFMTQSTMRMDEYKAVI